MPYKNLEDKRASDAAYRAAHAAEIRAYQVAYRKAHREEKRQYSSEYHAAHPDEARQRHVVNGAREKAHHRKRVADAKKGGCIDCGTKEGVLHFHHLDKSTKKYTVADMAGRSDSAFRDEVAKCVVVCQPCHNKRHPHSRKATDVI